MGGKSFPSEGKKWGEGERRRRQKEKKKKKRGATGYVLPREKKKNDLSLTQKEEVKGIIDNKRSSKERERASSRGEWKGENEDTKLRREGASLPPSEKKKKENQLESSYY